MKKTLAFAITIISAIILTLVLTSSQLLTNANVQPLNDLTAKGQILPELTVDPADDMEALEEDFTRNLTDYAAGFLGRRYVWGATGPKQFDCSGFTSYVFRNSGIKLHRTSRAQWTQGEKVDRKDLKPGDLMFFSSARSGKGRVGHVGIVVDVNPSDGSLTFIHASTSKGITYQKFPDGGYYSKRYIGAKRVIDADALRA